MTTTRGSDKVLEQLFGDTKVSAQQLAGAVEQARQAGFRFERWWWKGQPRPDFIHGVASIDPAQFAATVTDLIKLHNSANQVSFEAFPKGVPQIEAIDLHITVNRNIAG
jgi:hypothetical protein